MINVLKINCGLLPIQDTVKARVLTVDISQAKRKSCKTIIYEILPSNPA